MCVCVCTHTHIFCVHITWQNLCWNLWGTNINWSSINLGGTSGKEPDCQWRDTLRNRFDPWVEKIPLGRAWNPLQYSCPENPLDRGAWQATVYRITKSQTQLKQHPLEREMATHSSILAWKIPWTEEPDGLQSTGLQRVGHDWVTSLSLSHSQRLWPSQ